MIIFICAALGEQNDKEYMLCLYEEYKNLMFATARKYVSNQLDVEDIIQGSLLKLIDKVQILRPMGHKVLSSYIVAVVRNTSINFLKREGTKREHISSLDDMSAEPELPAPALDELLIRAERISQLSKVWEKLPEESRRLLEQKYILDYSDEAIAKFLGCKPGSVRMKLTRARRAALKLLLENDGGDLNDKT